MAKRIVLAFDIIDEDNNSIIGEKQHNSITTPLLANEITSKDIIDIQNELFIYLVNIMANEQIGHLFHQLRGLPEEGLNNSKWTESSPRPFSYLRKHTEFQR